MRRPLIAGNWKMNGTRQSVTALLEALKHGCERLEVAELAVFPPYVFLELCERLLMRTQIAWGAQNVCDHADGAYTGEISAAMLTDFNCHYAIVGHSERRQLYGETNDLIAAKFLAVKKVGICPILCVGETLAERDAGETTAVISEQLAAVLKMPDNLSSHTEWVIAYEPVWAIGTGRQATPEQVQEVHVAIRAQLTSQQSAGVRILYGGSVKADNAKALLTMPDVDGVLVGGASLQAEQFLEIGQLCNHLS